MARLTLVDSHFGAHAESARRRLCSLIALATWVRRFAQGFGVMTWTGVVWREAGPYGPGGIFVQQMRLGPHTFPAAPEVGRIIQIDGKDYRVVSVAGRFCHVRGESADVEDGLPWGDDPGGTSHGSRPIRWRAAGLGTT